MIDFTQADRDELRGQDWMRSLPQAEHAAIPITVDGGTHVFQASCRCRWKGPIHRAPRGAAADLENLNTSLWLDAAADADAHNAQHANEPSRRTG